VRHANFAAQDPAAHQVLVDPWTGSRARRSPGSRDPDAPGAVRYARPAGRAILRGDAIRHAVALTDRNTSRGRRDFRACRRRARRCGPVPYTPSSGSTTAAPG
jgi:hypothetical protein